MCKYVKNSHSCQHKSLKLTDTCQYALSSSPGSCGRMCVIDRKYVRHACEECTRKRAQVDFSCLDNKINVRAEWTRFDATHPLHNTAIYLVG
ncbi:hypothetical protein H072_9755 [Dactylellina haptotyla CBS 200.50]|uniref:Uncharacterized protein n=1 Tax=Dactylellina haptotyla (strain CBS 200.50) TaxID=1284197 RepID=S8BN68_DACHA|nr:hypothetical protein H072_9755 [Dactylellina haptotyla CBS 200.50]